MAKLMIKKQKKSIIEKIDEFTEKNDWMKNNMIIQGWNLGKKFRRR